MKISELIVRLQSTIRDHGDLKVYTFDGMNDVTLLDANLITVDTAYFLLNSSEADKNDMLLHIGG